VGLNLKAPWAVVKDDQDNVVAKRRASDVTYETTRAWLHEIFPGRVVASPLEKAPADAKLYSVYLSWDENGVGRVSALNVWAVEKRQGDS
jgi:hypothetical protein